MSISRAPPFIPTRFFHCVKISTRHHNHTSTLIKMIIKIKQNIVWRYHRDDTTHLDIDDNHCNFNVFTFWVDAGNVVLDMTHTLRHKTRQAIQNKLTAIVGALIQLWIMSNMQNAVFFYQRR